MGFLGRFLGRVKDPKEMLQNPAPWREQVSSSIPAQWSVAVGSSQLTLRTPCTHSEDRAFPRSFRLEPGPTRSRYIPFVLKMAAQDLRDSDELVLSPMLISWYSKVSGALPPL